MDYLFASPENFEFITDRQRYFIAALKDNRLVALSEGDKGSKRFVRVDQLNFSAHTAVQGWLKDYVTSRPLNPSGFHKQGQQHQSFASDLQQFDL